MSEHKKFKNKQIMRYGILFLLILSLPFSVYAQSDNQSQMDYEVRYVRSKSINVYDQPSKKSEVVGKLSYMDRILIYRTSRNQEKTGIWLKVYSPTKGYIFQKRLVRKQEPAKPATKMNTPVIESKTVQRVSQEQKSYFQAKSQSDFWLGFELSLFSIPQESGYSSSTGDTLGLFYEKTVGSDLLSQFRFGLNLSSSQSSNFKLDTNSLYAAYRYPINFIHFSGFEFYALGGLALMQSSISKGVSGSDSGIGFVLGAVSYYNLQSFGFPSWMNGGAQYMMFSRQANFGSVEKYVGSNQINLFIGSRF